VQFDDSRRQNVSLGARHVRHVERVADMRIIVFHDLDRPAERLLKNAQGSAPSIRIAIPEMGPQRFDRRRHEFLERGSAGLGLRRLAWPATEVAACAAGRLELDRVQARQNALRSPETRRLVE
jgi:hypothetical protein